MPLAVHPKVYIIVLNWNGWQDTLECLASLEQLRYPNFETVVVDNASTDNSVDIIKKTYPDIVLLESEANLGYASGNNLGIRYAMEHGTDYIWILNNDTVVDEEALGSLVNKMEADLSIGMCGSKVIHYHRRETIQALAGGTYSRWLGTTKHVHEGAPVQTTCDEQEIEHTLDYILGASLLVSRHYIREVGLLNEDYFLYFEELDWAMRGKDRFSLGFASESIVYHKEGASIKATSQKINDKSPISDYYQIKNRLKFSWKYFRAFFPFVYLSAFYSIVNRIKRKQWDRIPMILKLFLTFNR